MHVKFSGRFLFNSTITNSLKTKKVRIQIPSILIGLLDDLDDLEVIIFSNSEKVERWWPLKRYKNSWWHFSSILSLKESPNLPTDNGINRKKDITCIALALSTYCIVYCTRLGQYVSNIPFFNFFIFRQAHLYTSKSPETCKFCGSMQKKPGGNWIMCNYIALRHDKTSQYPF